MKTYMTVPGTRLCWSELDQNSLKLGVSEWGAPPKPEQAMLTQKQCSSIAERVQPRDVSPAP